MQNTFPILHKLPKPFSSRAVVQLIDAIVLCICVAGIPVTQAAEIIPAERFSLDDYRGKLVYLDFWASWCGPCKSSFPFMSELQDRYNDQGLVIIAVNVDRDSSEALHFLEKFPSGFAVVLNPDGSLASEFKVLGMPSSYLIDASGAIIWSHKGFRKGDSETIENHIVQALSGRSSRNQTGLLIP